MEFYVAPLEAITGYVFRNAHHRHFPGADKYFIPFIEPKPNARKTWTGRVWNDIQPDHNKGINVVPQILTNKWEDFLWTTEHLEELGYTEVNLNLGCPSRTVVSKNRGSGFLYCLDELDAFLYYIFEQCRLKISIKTRVGRDDPDEFEEILRLYEKYPMIELIIHPRTQKDYYNGALTQRPLPMRIRTAIILLDTMGRSLQYRIMKNWKGCIRIFTALCLDGESFAIHS